MKMLEAIVTMPFLRKENNTKKSLKKYKKKKLKTKTLRLHSNPRLMLQSPKRMLKSARMSSVHSTTKVRSTGI